MKYCVPLTKASMCTKFKMGMTLIEVPFVVALFIIGSFMAFWASGKIGWLGYPLGFFGGIAVTLGALIGVSKICLWIWPERPVCRNGKCKAKDYELHRVGDKFYWFCRCKDRYYYDRLRFYQVRKDGSLVPYMIHRAFRGWISDTPEKEA